MNKQLRNTINEIVEVIRKEFNISIKIIIYLEKGWKNGTNWTWTINSYN